MPWPSPSQRAIASRALLTIGGGGAGGFGALAVMHKPSTAAVTASSILAALIVNAIGSVGKVLPEIIRAIAEARALLMRTRVRTTLLQAGMEPGKLAAAKEMLRLQSVDPDLPEGRRLHDEILARLLAVPRARSAGQKPGNGPRKPRGGPANNAANNVFPIHPQN